MSELPTPTGGTAIVQSTTSTFVQQEELPAMHEPRTLLACREVTAWAKRVRGMRNPVISEENWSGVSAGCFVGFLVFLLSADFQNHPGLHAGIVVAAIFTGISALVLASLAYVRRSRDRKDSQELADEMEAARDANSVGSK